MALFPEAPSLQKITRRVIDDIRTRMSTGAALLAHTGEAALAAVVAGVAHPLWQRLGRVARVSLWATATSTEYLEIWASIFGVFRKDPTKATSGSGEGVNLTGTNGTIVPVGTRWQRSPDGFEYVSTEQVVISLGQATAPIQAKESGAAGNVALGQTLFLIGTIPGLDSAGVVSATITNGIDREPLHQLQQRFFDRLRYPPKGGGKGDYVRWAKELPFVTRAWEYGKEPQLGYVTVRAVTDFEDADTAVLAPSERETLRAHLQDKMPLGLTAVVQDDVEIVLLNPEIRIQPYSDVVIAAAKKALYLALSRGRIGNSDGTESFPLSLLNQALLDEGLLIRHEFLSPTGNINIANKQVLTLGDPVFQSFP